MTGSFQFLWSEFQSTVLGRSCKSIRSCFSTEPLRISGRRSVLFSLFLRVRKMKYIRSEPVEMHWKMRAGREGCRRILTRSMCTAMAQKTSERQWTLSEVLGSILERKLTSHFIYMTCSNSYKIVPDPDLSIDPFSKLLLLFWFFST